MRLMSSPQEVCLCLTGQCNSRCAYCAHFSSASDVDQDLPKEAWLQFFKELEENAVMKVTLSGGEVFCRKDLRELIEGIVACRMRFGILTNGTLITDEMAAFLASTRRCNRVQVSIDGSSAATNDATRGPGNFHKTLEGIRCLQKHRLPMSVRITINKHNVYDLENIAKFLLEDLNIGSVSTNSANFQGLCREAALELQLSIEDRNFAMRELLRLKRKYNGRITANAGPLAEAENWLKMEKSRQQQKGALPNRGCLSACGGVWNRIAVRADGVIVPCDIMCHIELGRMNKDSLREIWLGHPELERLRNRKRKPLSEFAFCRDCEYIAYCTGDCPAIAYNYTGKEDHPCPDSCLRNFLSQGGKLPDESALTIQGGEKCKV